MKNKKVYVGAAFGLAFSALALAPILPMPFTGADVYAAEGTTLGVSTYDQLYDAVVNGDVDTVVLAGNIAEMQRVMTIPAERTVTIDLNDFSLAIGYGSNRGIINYGNLTVNGGGVMRNSDVGMKNSSKGLIDNFGTLTIQNVTLEDYGSHTASTIRNFSDTAKTNFMSGSKIWLLNDEEGNVGISATKGEVFVDDGTEITSAASTYYPLQVNNGKMTIGTEGSANPAVIKSKASAVYVYGASGELVVNNATIESENKAIYVKNNSAKVTINGGKFTAPYGGIYVYTTARGTQPLVTINGGEFSGRWASLMSTNGAGDLETWAFDIRGGVFAGTRIKDYLSAEYKTYRVARYFENGWAGYFVRPAGEENVPETLYLKKGTDADFGLSEDGQRFATITMDRDDVVTIEGGRIRANKTGIVMITTNLNDGSEPMTTMVYAYDNLLSAAFMAADRFDAGVVAALDAKMEGEEQKVGYLDVNYAQVIDGLRVEEITESETPVTVLVELPELPKVADGYKRSFRVLHYVNGAVEEVAGAKVDKRGMLGFETTTFEPFLVVYLDTLIPVEEPGDEPSEEPGGETGGEEDPDQPAVIQPDQTFDYEDPAEVDPLGETYTKLPTVNGGSNSSNGGAVKAPNTAGTENATEINLVIAMMVGAFATAGAMAILKKQKR